MGCGGYARPARRTMTAGRIGFLGLGTMGRPMALRLLNAGVELRVFDIAADAVNYFTAKGVISAATPRALGEWADILIFMVPHPDGLRDNLLGPQGAIHTLRAGSVVIDMSTNGPAVVKTCGEALAARGIEMMDAPVGKGPTAAAKGDLTILMGGKREVCAAAEPILRHFGTELHYCGPLGSGQVVKLVNNMVSCANAAVLAEACGLAHNAGVDLGVLTGIMAGTAADSHQLRHTLMGKALKSDFEPAFKLKLAYKDMRFALQMARELNATSACTGAAVEWYERAAAAGYGELDRAALLLVVDPRMKKA